MNTLHTQKSFWTSRYMLIGVVFGIITTTVSILLASFWSFPAMFLIAATLWGIFAFSYFYLIEGKCLLRWRSLIWFVASGISLHASMLLFANVNNHPIFIGLFTNNSIFIGLSGSIIVLFGFFLSDFSDKKNIFKLDVVLALAIGLIASYSIYLPKLNLPAHLSSVALFPFLIWQTGMLLILGNMVYKRTHIHTS